MTAPDAKVQDAWEAVAIGAFNIGHLVTVKQMHERIDALIEAVREQERARCLAVLDECGVVCCFVCRDRIALTPEVRDGA
jgi:hypothetical protein